MPLMPIPCKQGYFINEGAPQSSAFTDPCTWPLIWGLKSGLKMLPREILQRLLNKT